MRRLGSSGLPVSPARVAIEPNIPGTLDRTGGVDLTHSCRGGSWPLSAAPASCVVSVRCSSVVKGSAEGARGENGTLPESGVPDGCA